MFYEICNMFLQRNYCYTSPKMTVKKMLLLLPALLAVWILADLYWPYKTDIKKINAPELARLDGAMWRSYYEQKAVKMFLQTAELIRGQYHVPFWQSNVMAYHAAKAALTFKKGKDTADYNKALPDLEKYFAAVNNISNSPFDYKTAAKLEIRWWTIRRYREVHLPAEWEDCLAKAAGAVYHVPEEKFTAYAKLRTEAMLYRDEKGNNITESDWRKVDSLLRGAWANFGTALR
jgi:hypothetical protein